MGAASNRSSAGPGHEPTRRLWQTPQGPKAVVLGLRQEQAGAVFRLPLDIGIAVSGVPVRVARIVLEGRYRKFEIDCESRPDAVNPDPDVEALMTVHWNRK